MSIENKTYDIIYGRGPVLEVIENSNLKVNKIWIFEGLNDAILKDRIISYGKKNKVPYNLVPLEKINRLAGNKNNQGVALSISPIEYLELNELISKIIEEDNSKDKNKLNTGSCILIAHEIEDAHNLGAMIRTFIASGGKGIILTGKNNIGINSTIVKTSAGTLFQALFSRHTNCNQVIEKLKENGFWIVGTSNEENAQSIYKTDFPDQIAIVMGNEHEGLSSLVKKNCDFLLKIPISNLVDSLNVSVAFGIILFEFLRQKLR